VAELELRHGATESEFTIVVAGEIDMANAPRLRELLDEAIQAGGNSVVLDCTDLDFLDSSGIGVLVAARQRLGDSGELVLDGPPAHVRKVLDIAGVAGHLTVK
jgi:anti-sigma B factor antagonist